MRIFARVIDEGGFARAARALTLAPPVVTRAVAELESHLGARLVNRTTRHIALTEVGTRYLEKVRAILVEIDESEEVARDGTRAVRGHLRLLCPAAVAVHQLAKHLPSFRLTRPQVTIEIASPSTVDTVDDSFDLTVFTRREAPDGDFVARRLACSEVVICAAPQYLDQRGRPEHPQALVEHDMLLPPGTVRGAAVFRARSAVDGNADFELSMKRQPLLSTGHMDTLYAAALSGLGVAGLPSYMIEDALMENALERVLPAWRLFDIGLWVGMPSRHHVPARTRAFLDFLLEVFGGADHDPWLAAAGCATSALDVP